MKPRPTHLDVLNIKKVEVSNLKQVRYRVYQSASEYIAVIAESALMAIRISGVENPYKVVRDLPTSGIALEKGLVQVPESAERVPLSVEPFDDSELRFEAAGQQDNSEPFETMAIADIHKKKMTGLSVLEREEAMRYFGVPEHAPTLAQPAAMPEKPAALPVAAPEPEVKKDPEILSQEEIAKLLGDA